MSLPEFTEGTLPLFPLPNIALFPGQTLPLHIFEPRYRQLGRDARDTSGRIVMVRIKPGFEDLSGGIPPLCGVAGLGRIIGAQDLPDGRSLLLLVGQQRVRIARELRVETPYRQALCVALDSRQNVADDVVRASLAPVLRSCRRMLEQANSEVAQLDELIASQPDSHQLLDLLCAAFAPGPAARQTLLETLNPLERCAVLSGILTRVLGTPRDLN